MIKAVLFDFDETLQDRTTAFESYMNAFFTLFMPGVPKEELTGKKEYMRKTGNGGYFRAAGYETRDVWFLDLINTWGWQNAPEPSVLTQHYDSTFSDHNVILPEAPGMMRQLKEKGMKLGIITNGPSELQHEKIEKSGLAGFLDIVVVSDDIDIQKPEKGIFEYAAKKLGLTCKECVYVGDHPVNDIEGALGAGMYAVRMNFGWFKGKNLRDDVPTITNLSALPAVIEEIDRNAAK